MENGKKCISVEKLISSFFSIEIAQIDASEDWFESVPDWVSERVLVLAEVNRRSSLRILMRKIWCTRHGIRFAWIDKWILWKILMGTLNFARCFPVCVCVCMYCYMWSGLSTLSDWWIWNFSNVYSDTVHERSEIKKKLRRLFFNPIRSVCICWTGSSEQAANERFLFNEMCRVLFNHHTRSPHSVVYFSDFVFFSSSSSSSVFISLNIYNLLFVWFCFALCFLLQARTNTFNAPAWLVEAR